MTTIHYIDAVGQNYYEFHRDTIVLDERLKYLPLAHNYVLAHELGHAGLKGTDILGNLRHEFWNDVKMYFGQSEEIRELSAYNRQQFSREIMKKVMAVTIVNTIRLLWQAPMMILGFLWKKTGRFR